MQTRVVLVEHDWRQYAEWVNDWQGGVLDERLPAYTFGRLEGRMERLVEYLGTERALFDAA